MRVKVAFTGQTRSHDGPPSRLTEGDDEGDAWMTGPRPPSPPYVGRRKRRFRSFDDGEEGSELMAKRFLSEAMAAAMESNLRISDDVPCDRDGGTAAATAAAARAAANAAAAARAAATASAAAISGASAAESSASSAAPRSVWAPGPVRGPALPPGVVPVYTAGAERPSAVMLNLNLSPRGAKGGPEETGDGGPTTTSVSESDESLPAPLLCGSVDDGPWRLRAGSASVVVGGDAEVAMATDPSTSTAVIPYMGRRELVRRALRRQRSVSSNPAFAVSPASPSLMAVWSPALMDTVPQTVGRAGMPAAVTLGTMRGRTHSAPLDDLPLPVGPQVDVMDEGD